MPTFSSIEESAHSLLPLIQSALSARDQEGWSQWLQGELQMFLPHETLVAAWGDFKAGHLECDVVTRAASDAAQPAPRRELKQLMRTLFDKGVAAAEGPIVLQAEDLWTLSKASLSFVPCALALGVRHHRAHFDCLYLFLGSQELASPFSREMSRLMLPYIDAGFRQFYHGSQEQPEDDGFSVGLPQAHRTGLDDSRFGQPGWGEVAGERGSALSAREVEIMQWVRMGKTNAEIAMILNRSTFTVKNHMRRIYRKLDVFNRAQAVGSMDRMTGMTQHR